MEAALWLCLACAAPVSSFVISAQQTRPSHRRWAVDEVRQQLAGQELVVQFDCFGFKQRDCIVLLDTEGSVEFRAGMISNDPGEWRVVSGDPNDGESASDCYLEFTQPMTELYTELYNVPGGVVYWRGRVVPSDLSIVDGLAISESNLAKSLSPQSVLARIRGIRFQREGTFSAKLAKELDPESLPQPVSIEFMDSFAADQPAANNPENELLPQNKNSKGQSDQAKPRRARKTPGAAPQKGFGGSS